MNHAVQRKVVLALARIGHHTGASALLQARRRERRDHRVFIFNWHRLATEDAPREQAVSTTRFRQQVLWLREKMPITTLDDALDQCEQGLATDLGVLTFDDGYADSATLAWPILRELEVPATFFLTTGLLDGTSLWFDRAATALRALRARPDVQSGAWPPALRELGSRASIEECLERLKTLSEAERREAIATLEDTAGTSGHADQPMSWADAKRMHETGMEIGCHSVNHPIFSELEPARQETEIRDSRQRLEEELGIHSRLFAYPNGRASDFTEDTVRLLRDAGFRAACTTIRGSNRPDADPFRLRRIGVGDDPPWMLEARMNGLAGEGMRRLVGRRA